MSMAGWCVIYPGKSDALSSAGICQPSWGDFDKRVWEHDGFRLELTRGFGAPKNKAGCYVVSLEHKGVELLLARGTSWQLLVKLAKQYANESGSGEKTDGHGACA